MPYNKESAIAAGSIRKRQVPGCSVSVYVQPRNMKHYRGIKKMASERDSSFSEIFNDTLRQVYFGQRTGVTISADAYLAIANGDLDALITIQRPDGGVELTLNQKALSPDTMDCPDRTFPELGSRSTVYAVGLACLYDAVEPSELMAGDDRSVAGVSESGPAGEEPQKEAGSETEM